MSELPRVPESYPTTAPPIGPARSLHFPAFTVRELASGLRVYAAQQNRLPLVRMDLLIPAGAIHDGPEQAGLATLVASLLDEGPVGSTATERAEQLGGDLHTGATWNTAIANVTLFSKHLVEGLQLLERVALEASFPEQEVERLRHQRLANLLQQRRDPSLLAERALARTLYGSSVYGRPLYGSLGSVGPLTRDDFLAFHDRHYTLRNMALVAVGDFEVEELLARVEETFAMAPDRAPVAAPDLSAPEGTGRAILIVDVPDAPQVQLRIGQAGPPYADPRFTLAEMVNSILGGRFTSRINLRLREQLGYTYGAQSQFLGRLGPGPFEISTAVATPVVDQAVEAILEELHRIRNAPVEAQELADTRHYLRGNLIHQLQTVEELVNKLSLLPIFHLPDDHYARYLQTLAQASADDLQQAAQVFLRPEEAAIIAVGPATVLVPQLETFGPVSVLDPLTDYSQLF